MSKKKKNYDEKYEPYIKSRSMFHKPTRVHKKKKEYNRKDKSWKNLDNW